MYILQIIFIDFRQRCDLNCAVALAKWIIHALNLEERVVNVVNSVLSVPIEDWTELASVFKTKCDVTKNNNENYNRVGRNRWRQASICCIILGR